MVRRHEILARIPLFRSLDQEQIRRLDTRCSWRQYDIGNEIVSYEEIGTDVFFVVAGQVRAQILRADGRPIILRTIQAGEWFGELAALDGGPRSASIVSVTNSIVARMRATTFREAVHAYSDVCDQLLALLTGQIRNVGQPGI